MSSSTTAIEAPYYANVAGGLRVGTQIIVRGKVRSDLGRFYIDLQSDQVEGCDVAFHFNPRTADQTVVRNSYAGSWQEEELDIPHFPFVNGSSFTVRIYVVSESYVVLVNDQFFIEYKHRLPYQNVHYVKLTEGAEYYECTIQYPSRILPYTRDFSGGFRVGKAVRVRGYVHEDATGFAINFCCDIDGNNVGVRFNPQQDKQDVVLNTKEGSWGQEERGQEWFPFPRGEYFDVLFIASVGCFEIYVNKRLLTSYNYRIPLEQIKYLNISGDVTLMDVVFLDQIPDDYVKAIPSGLARNDLISIKGFFYPTGNMFSINLINGTSLGNDIALYINHCRNEDTVVLNNQRNSSFQNEERHPLPSTFKDKIPFEVEIVNEDDKFKIYANGQYFASFTARGKVEDIKGINAHGQAYIYEVKLLKKLDTPFVERLPGAFEIGSWVKVIGTPKKNAKRFHINLQRKEHIQGKCDVAFHFNPHFDENCTLCCTRTCDAWGEAERLRPNFPFVPEDRFEVTILRLSDVFKVFVNQRFYLNYAHRIDANCISYVLLGGDCNFFEPEFY